MALELLAPLPAPRPDRSTILELLHRTELNAPFAQAVELGCPRPECAVVGIVVRWRGRKAPPLRCPCCGGSLDHVAHVRVAAMTLAPTHPQPRQIGDQE